MGDRVTSLPMDLRDAAAEWLRAAVAGASPPVNVYSEEPDALVPPALVVTWEGSTPAGDQWGVWSTRLDVECWPSTDLAASAYAASRDALLSVALDLAGTWQQPGQTVESFTSGNEVRSLGGQSARIAVVSLSVLSGAPC